MKEVVKVSIGGYAFTLDVEAYEEAKKYLDELQSYYSSRSGGDEIMEGIEERFAELLYNRMGSDGVASRSEVASVMAILGKPSAIESDDDAPELPSRLKPEEESRGQAASPDPEKPVGMQQERRRLFRDPDHHIFGGVCTGLANYFGVDVVLVRIIWVALLILGLHLSDASSWDSAVLFPVLGYLFCWIAMPVPKNQYEKNSFARSSTSTHKSEGWTAFGRICCTVIGILLLLIGGIGLVAFIGVACGAGVLDLTRYVPEALDGIVFKSWYWIPVVLASLLPSLFFIYEGVRLTFDLRPPKSHPGLICVVIWVLSLAALLFIGLFSLIPMM